MPLQAQNLTDTNILNFALNLEYLEVRCRLLCVQQRHLLLVWTVPSIAPSAVAARSHGVTCYCIVLTVETLPAHRPPSTTVP